MLIDEEEEEDDQEPKEIEPLVQSVTRKDGKSKYLTSTSKVHEYQIDPIVEYGPGQVGSFRSRKSSTLTYVPPNIQSAEVESPRKSLLKKPRLSQVSMYSSNSAKKTVRFAESASGLLKAVQDDPTFNDSDYYYDMRHNL